MPELAPPAITAETLAAIAQPILFVDSIAVLRPWRETDAVSLMEAFTDESIQRWHVRRADSAAEAGEWIATWNDAWIARTDCTWAVVDPHSDERLGRISLKDINRRDGVADVAYWMMPAARGHGICPRSVDAVTRWAFESVGITRLQLEHSTLNEASCRVAQKAGFIVEGTRRGAARHADGWHDMHLHGRLSGA